jgi:hypothetical protein
MSQIFSRPLLQQNKVTKLGKIENHYRDILKIAVGTRTGADGVRSIANFMRILIREADFLVLS